MIDVAREIVAQLRSGRAVTMRATGGSMAPTIASGSLVRVAPCDARGVAIGDVAAVVRPDGGLALHRVVARCAAGGALTWGDALARPDAWPSHDVIGRVVRREPQRPGLRASLRVAARLAVAPILQRLDLLVPCGCASGR